MAKKGGAPTKSEILAQISKDAELSRKQVGEVFESLNGIIKKSLRGNGLFTLPGLLKLKRLVDGGFFVSSSAINPALTIMANALRVGDHLVQRLFS